MIISGNGGRNPNELCGVMVLYSFSPLLNQNLYLIQSIKDSPFNNSPRIFLLNDSVYTFSQGLPGSIKSGLI